MPGLDSQYREYVRRAWNKLVVRPGVDIYMDGRLLPREGASVDRLLAQFETATTVGKIGPEKVRAMIDRLVYVADADWMVSHDILVNFTTQPFGTVIWRAKSEFTDETGEFYPEPPDAGLTDNVGAAFEAAGQALLQWAIQEGLKALQKIVTDWLSRPETYGISITDRRVNQNSQLSVWVGRADDTANVFINGEFVGAVDIQFPKGANFYLQGHLRPGRNVLTIELRNSGRGRWSIAGKFFAGQQPWGDVFGGSQDDGIMDRTRIFYCNIWLQ